MGVLGDWRMHIEREVQRGKVTRYVPDSTDPIPSAWDAAEAFPQCAKTIGDIRDQSNCGCCWAFAGAEAASDRMCIASKAQLLMPSITVKMMEPKVQKLVPAGVAGAAAQRAQAQHGMM